MFDRIESTVARMAQGARALGFFVLLATAFAQAQTSQLPLGTGTEADPYQIANLANLQWVSSTSMAGNDFTGKHFLQTADIDASPTATWYGGSGWQPIGWPSYSQNNVVFSGFYDGQGFAISGLTMNRSEVDLGLFGALFNASLENVHLVNVRIEAGAGATGDFVGGLVGELYGARVENCTVTGTVHGYNAVGGLVGVLNDPMAYGADSANRIVDCRTDVAVVVDNMGGGGLVGAGYDPGARMEQCVATGTTLGATTMLPGQAAGEIGGLVGYLNGGTLTRSYATGRVFGFNAAGGLVGRNAGNISDCFASGLVEGSATQGVDHGGLVGKQEAGTVSHSFATGSTNGSLDYQGGLIGRILGGTVTASCHWNASVQAAGLGALSATTGFAGEGKSTAQLQTASSFVGWNIAAWSIDNARYPKVQLKPTVSTQAASSITAVAATMGGDVTDDGGADVTERGVVYSATDSAPAIGDAAVAKDANGTGIGTYGKSIAGLAARTTYFARAFATNGNGTRYGGTIRFTTDSSNSAAPEASTGGASAIDTGAATVHGAVNANNATTADSVQYGTTTSYGTTVAATPGTSTGTIATAISASLSGLQPNTTYHYRVKAVNAAGTSYGRDSSFTTASSMQPQTIVFGALTARTYGDSPLKLTAQASSGLPVTYTSSNPAAVRISEDTAFLLAADTATITASQAGSAIHLAALPVSQRLTIAKKTLTIAGATAKNKTYDGTTDATIAGATLTGVEAGDEVTLVVGAARFSSKNAGTSKSVTVSGSALAGAQAGNYGLVEVAPLTANITAARITVTAQAKSKVIGSADPALTYTAPALFGSDTWSGSLGRCPGEKLGDYPIHLGTLSAGGNYTLSFVGAKLTITKLSGLATRSKGAGSNELGVKVDRTFASMARGSGAGSLGETGCRDNNCQAVEVVLPAPSRISVAIFDNLGNAVISLQEEIDGIRYRNLQPTMDGRKLLPVAWNLRSAMGSAVQPGVYLWKMEIVTEDGRKWETIKRLGVK